MSIIQHAATTKVGEANWHIIKIEKCNQRFIPAPPILIFN